MTFGSRFSKFPSLSNSLSFSANTILISLEIFTLAIPCSTAELISESGLPEPP